MANPLDEQLQFFRSAMDAFKITRRVLDRRRNPVSNTGLYGRTQDEGHAILDQAEEQLNKLVAFALFAAFERTLRDHLTSSLSPISGSSTIPEELVPYLRASAKNNKKFHAAISISCLVEAAKMASRVVANSRPLAVTR